ncbi:MAG: rhodanese-like domain-containing protein [Phycisphaerales bacterium JB059]
MPSKVCSTVGGMLSIVGLATVIGAVHSMYEPVKLRRASEVVEPSAPEPGSEEAPASGTEEAGEASTQVGVVTGTPVKQGEIDLAGVKAHFDEFGLFLDARTVKEYEEGHIPNAMWMPVDRVLEDASLVFEIEAEAGGMDQPIVIYCGGGSCDASHNLAIVLEEVGFTNLLVFVDGYPAWKDAGHEVELGAPLEYEP